MQEKLMEAGQYGRRFMELGEMYERTAVDERMSCEERAQEMNRLLHVMRQRLDSAAAVLELTDAEAAAYELVAA
jgi:hypothetical protein